jgi:hypothetical protein
VGHQSGRVAPDGVRVGCRGRRRPLDGVIQAPGARGGKLMCGTALGRAQTGWRAASGPPGERRRQGWRVAGARSGMDPLACAASGRPCDRGGGASQRRVARRSVLRRGSRRQPPRPHGLVGPDRRQAPLASVAPPHDAVRRTPSTLAGVLAGVRSSGGAWSRRHASGRSAPGVTPCRRTLVRGHKD